LINMRVGIIGVGTMGRIHARVYRELGVDLVGVADINPNAAEEIARKYEAAAYNNYEKLLEQSLDAVSVTTPTYLHDKVALKAISRGINVLVEKPICDTVEKAKKIISSARSSKVVLMVGQIERFNPTVKKLKEIIGERKLGELITLSSRRVGPFVERIKDVGIITDVGTHDIDIARYLTGKEPMEIYGKVRGRRHGKGDSAFILLDFEKVIASIELNWFTPQKVRSLFVTGTEGVAYVDYIEQSVVIYHSTKKEETKVEKDEPLRLELKHFLECVKEGKDPLITGEDGLKTLEIALKLEEKSLEQ
jgi:UDP-N-acetylglucosamine 3-dehydrogenase